jgi:hypothetical protein
METPALVTGNWFLSQGIGWNRSHEHISSVGFMRIGYPYILSPESTSALLNSANRAENAYCERRLFSIENTIKALTGELEVARSGLDGANARGRELRESIASNAAMQAKYGDLGCHRSGAENFRSFTVSGLFRGVRFQCVVEIARTRFGSPPRNKSPTRRLREYSEVIFLCGPGPVFFRSYL